MSASPLNKFLLRPVILSSAVFCFLTLPLAAFGSNQVTIQLQEEPIFYGKLRDIAAPYLGFATALSLGVAASSVVLAGWQQSSKKSAQLEDQLSAVQQNLKKTETQLQELKVSELQFQASGLNSFLKNEVSEEQQLTSSNGTTVAELGAVSASVQVLELVANAAQSVEPQPNVSFQESVFPIQSDPISVTTFAAVSETTSLVGNKTAEISLATLIAQAQSEPLTQIQELQGQFQQVMTRMDTLQEIILAKSQLFTTEAELSANYNNHSRNKRKRQQTILDSSQVSANFNSGRHQSPRQRPVPKAQRQQQKLVAS